MTIEQQNMILEAYPLVNGLVYGKYKNIACQEEREDRVSIIMLKLMNDIDKFDPSRASLSTWVGMITITTLFGLASAFKKHIATTNGIVLSLDAEYEQGNGETTTMLDFLPAEDVDALQIVYETQLWKAARPILDKMNSSMRTSFIYVNILGYTISETARERNLSRQAVSIHVMRARRRLKRALRSFCYKEDTNDTDNPTTPDGTTTELL